MKEKIVLMLGWFLATVCLVPGAMAQERKGSEFGDQFYYHHNSHIDLSKIDETKPGHGESLFSIGSKEMRYNVKLGKDEMGLFTKLNPKLTGYLGTWITMFTKSYHSFTIADNSDAILVALGITKDNIKDFKYHVVKNDSIEIVPWSPIPKLEQKYGAPAPYGAIGTFNSPNGTIMVEVVNTKNYGMREGVVYDWRGPFKPVVESITVNGSDFSYTLTKQGDIKTSGDSPVSVHVGSNHSYKIMKSKSNNSYSKGIDPVTGLPAGIEFPADSIESLRLNFKPHETVAYTIYLEKLGKDSTELIQLKAVVTYNYYDVETEFLKIPGKYRLKIVGVESTPGENDNRALYIPFEVKPPPPVTNKKVSLKQALPYIIATLSGVALLFYAYYRYSQGKLKVSARERQLAGLKLKSIRSQLNPHFMFNALTSIQNLINKKNIEGANYYLSIFSGLTRQVLDTNNEEQLSIQDELKILDDYLQMEQLRFGFQYHIKVDSDLNQANIDIPAMLLQPFVENAVKHGVAALKEVGNIVIQIGKENNDIVFSIADNGKGFNKEAGNMGYGMKLSEERIALLNQIYKEQSVALTVESNTMGTTITIRLANWVI